MACTKVRIRRSRPRALSCFRDADSLAIMKVRIAVGVAGGLSTIISRRFVTGSGLGSDHYRPSAGPQSFRPDLTTYSTCYAVTHCSSFWALRSQDP